MPDRFTIEGYDLEKEWLENQVQFIVTNKDGYLCRLVPGENGFELSKLDRVLRNEIPADLLAKLSNGIESHEA